MDMYCLSEPRTHYARIMLVAVGESSAPGGDPAPIGQPPAVVLPPTEPMLQYPSMAGMKNEEGGRDPYPRLDYSSMTKSRIIERDGTESKFIPLPDNPTTEELSAYRAAVGIPATPDEYQVDRSQWPAHLGDYPAEVEQGYLRFAHEHNLTPAQVKANYDWYMKNLANAGAQGNGDALEASFEDGVSTLRTEWGEEAEANVSLAVETFHQFADEGLIGKVDRSRLGNDPAFIKLFHQIGLVLRGENRPLDTPSRFKKDLKRDSYGQPRLSYPSMGS